ncbi:MAG: efflux RND transporter periplasmic adaptor subunit [Deltaproteobacteria bacterium]|nr:efflux RND transporter periplasmic adaptor subunit [Deltaproteobacteria bacterium]
MESKSLKESDIAETLELGHDSGGGKGRKKWVIIGGVILLAIITVLMIWKNKNMSNTVQYKTQKVTQSDLTVLVTATGTLQPTNTVDIGSELSGIIKSVEVDYNDKVKIGQVLARLDTTRLEAQVTQAKAALNAAKAKIMQTRATVKEARRKLTQLQNLQQLSGNKLPAQADMDAAEATLERALADEVSAEAAVAQATATLDAYETDLSKAVIISPINGIVLNRSVEPGQTVAATLQAPTLFTLAEDLTKMELHVNVDEADIGKVEAGQSAAFTVAAYADRTFRAKITQARYGSTTTSGVVTYETVLKVDNSDLVLRPGMTATAEITVKNLTNVFLIPNTALRFRPPMPSRELQNDKKSSGGLVGSLFPRRPRRVNKSRDDAQNNKKDRQIWILKDGRPVAVPIDVGATNGSVTEVTAGDLHPGMDVLVDYVEKRS